MRIVDPMSRRDPEANASRLCWALARGVMKPAGVQVCIPALNAQVMEWVWV